MRVAFFMAMVAGLIIFGGLIALSLPGAEETQPDRKARAGKEVWQKYGCVECHCLFGHGGYNGPDLTHVISLRGKPWVDGFLARGPVMRPAQRKRHLKLAKTRERQEVIAYLTFVGSLPMVGWPPKPQSLGKKGK